jgi:hypothetical protein
MQHRTSEWLVAENVASPKGSAPPLAAIALTRSSMPSILAHCFAIASAFDVQHGGLIAQFIACRESNAAIPVLHFIFRGHWLNYWAPTIGCGHNNITYCIAVIGNAKVISYIVVPGTKYEIWHPR